MRNRSVGGLGMSDLLTTILIANALQEGLIGRGSSITEGVVSKLTVIGWSSLIDWAAFRWPAMERLVRSSAVPLIRTGTGAGSEVSDIGTVRAAYAKENGEVSLVLR